MPLQTGTATSNDDLLQQLVTWLAGLGWTTDLSAADGTGWRAHLDKGGNFIHLRTYNAEKVFFDEGTPVSAAGVALYLSTAFNTLAAWNAQPGAPPLHSGHVVGVAARMSSLGAITGYWFFADSSADNIIVVVSLSGGLYTFFGWGSSVAKLGAWTGGPYFFGADDLNSMLHDPSLAPTGAPALFSGASGYPLSFVRADVDTFTGLWLSMGLINLTGKAGASSGSAGFGGQPPDIAQYSTTYLGRQTSAMNAQANLLPPLLWAARDAGGYSPIGTVPNVFYSNGVGQGYASGEEYILGADHYVMFPNFAVLKH